MARQNLRFCGRKQTAPRLTWTKFELMADGALHDITPTPGHTYTRASWPPRGRGRGEALDSPRRINAKLRAREVIRLRIQGCTWQSIARSLGFADASGPYRAYRRTIDRIDWDAARRKELQQQDG